LVPIFVVGHPRSGTTWVYDLLTAHPKVEGALETWLFTYRWGVAPLFHPRHWSEEVHSVDEGAVGHRLGLAQFMTREELAERVRAATLALLPAGAFVVEKSPDHYQTVWLIAEVFPEARFIHVIRDGRDVLVSMRAGEGWAGYTPRFARSAKDAANRWRYAVQWCREQGAGIADRFCEVQYERLHADAINETRRLFEFCGMHGGVEEAVQATAISKYETGEDRFRRAGRVGDWRQSLGWRDRRRYWKVAGRLLTELGYEP
jgi:hypothetical protein